MARADAHNIHADLLPTTALLTFVFLSDSNSKAEPLKANLGTQRRSFCKVELSGKGQFDRGK
jgi:hypothetical protein